MARHRSKRDKSKTTDSTTTTTTTTTTTSEPPSLRNPSTLSPAQFFTVVCVALAVTHTLDLHHTVNNTSTTSSDYCSRFFLNVKDPTYKSPCSPNDIAVLTLRYHATVVRIFLTVVVSIICWNMDAVLRVWNLVYGVCPLAMSLIGMGLCRNELRWHEAYGLGCLFVFGTVSNYFGGMGGSGGGALARPLTPVYLMEGMHNIVLFLIVVATSYVVVDHLLPFGGMESYLKSVVEEDGGKEGMGFSDGAKATWFMTILVECVFWMSTAVFAFFFLDEGQKRGLLLAKFVLFLVQAFYYLPIQKDIWIDGPTRQTIFVLMAVASFVGGVLPPFKNFVVKR